MSIGISHSVSCPQQAWALSVIFFLLHRLASQFPSQPVFFGEGSRFLDISAIQQAFTCHLKQQ